MEDYRLDQSGQEVQDILNGAAMQSDLTAETERATEAEQTLQDNIDAEATRAQGAEGTLQDNIDAEEARAKAAEKQNADDIDAIEEKIPSGASSSNKLATEEYVADAVATATATFRGTYNLVSDLHLNVTATEQQISAALAGAISTADNNDYCFILVPTSSETPTEIKEIDRYKFNGTAWAFEYKLNNSGFNAAQWAAINSGITSGDVAKLAALPTNAQLTTLLAGLQSDIDGEETRAKAAELAIQGNIDAEEVRAKAAEKQNADDIDAIEAVLPESASSENKVATESEINSLSAAIEAILLLIPSAATSLNKLADKAFVNSSIATATATFRGTYNLVNDLGLTTSATHAQIATALAGAILTADNNDYAFVQIPTSDAMPTEIAKTERYKFNGTAWEYEYDLNNSGFTADQWAAINSGITQALVTKLSALPTNAELTTELGTLTSGINAINQKIPAAASQANKLVDTAAMESYIVQVLDVLTASFNVTSTDEHVTVQISQVDGKITSVAVSTSDIASAADLNLKASQADLTALASRVTTAEGNITTLGGRITTAEGNITSLGDRMTTAEGNITTINGNITSLGGRVSTNETDIANLQELYNSLQQSKPVPVDALPETGQQQGVIYRLSGTTSYSDYMWNGSTWVLMATYNNAIDPRPKKASQNLVTSGGVFDNMGALDVSELNATENPHTLAQYTDLSAALAAIPTDYQKGGMSIKFVQSSDNKYVKFTYLGTETTGSPNPFLDVNNWIEDFSVIEDIKKERIDKSPSVDAVATMVNGYTLELLNSWEAGFIRTNGDSVDTSVVEQPNNYRHLLVPCSGGDKFTISGTGAAGARLWCFIDTNNVPLDRASGAMTADCLLIEAPENSVYLIINDNNTGNTCYKGKTISEKIKELEEKNEVVVLTNINTVPTYPSNLQVGDCFYISGNSYRKVTAVRGDGFPSGYDSIPLRKDVIYRCNNSLYYYDGTTLQKFNDEQLQEHRLKMSAVMLNIANPTPSNEDVVYPVLWGVKYNNSKNVTNGYGEKAHAIPVGWLYYDKNNMNDIYYSFGVADKMTKILTWNSAIADGYTPMHYQPIICKNGDIVCVPRAENYPSSDSPQTRTKNPIIYKHGDYENPVVINVSDSVYGIKPVSWFSNSGVCFIDDQNCFVFAEYTRPDFEPANIWKVSYPFDTPSNWNIVLHTTGTGEGTRDVEHFHCVNLDPFTDMLYAASGDSATESKIWESDDFGSTWVLKFDAGGDENKRTLARMLNWIFTKEAAYYGSDQSPYLNRINRGDNGKMDFDTIARIGQLSANSSNVYVGQTYYTCLIDEPFGLLLLQQRGDTSGKDNAVFFYSLERKFKVGEVVRWKYSDNGTIVEMNGTIESTTDGESGTIFLGLGVTATFDKGLTTGANSVETSRLYYDSRYPEFHIHEIMVLPPVDIPQKYPNGFRCEAVNVYQSRAEKRIICGFGLAPNYNEMAGNKNPSEINNLALEVY